MRILIAVALALLGACTTRDRIDRLADPRVRDMFDQDVAAPLVRGVAYDVARERVFFAVCDPIEFECDLLVVGQNGGAAQRVLASQTHGYTWPAVSPDGARLAVVRTLRNQRPQRRSVEQELVEIDLETGNERLIATSNAGRFDRLQYVTSGLLVLRNFRSSESVGCYQYTCSDWAEFLLFRDGSSERLPIEAAADSGVLGGRISLVPLPEGRIWIEAALRPLEDSNGLATRIVHAWVLDNDGELRGPMRNITERRQLLGEVQLDGWFNQQMLTGRVGRIEYRPFDGTGGDDLQLTQLALSGVSRGAFIRKVRSGRRFSLHVEAIARSEEDTWQSIWVATAGLPERVSARPQPRPSRRRRRIGGYPTPQ